MLVQDDHHQSDLSELVVLLQGQHVEVADDELCGVSAARQSSGEVITLCG